jgi:hypothetical protein
VSPRAPVASPAPAPPRSSGGERIVAVILAAMAAVLLWVWLDVRRASALHVEPVDLVNPLLAVQAEECIEVEDSTVPGVVSRLVVISPAPPEARGTGAAVLRTRLGPASIPGYVQAGQPDLRTSAPYLACEVRPGNEDPEGAPAGKREVLLFDLNAFGLPRGARPMVVWREARPALLRWEGKPQRTHQVTITRYDRLHGNWFLYLTPDVPASGCVLRKYFGDGFTVEQAFHRCR